MCSFVSQALQFNVSCLAICLFSCFVRHLDCPAQPPLWLLCAGLVCLFSHLFCLPLQLQGPQPSLPQPCPAALNYSTVTLDPCWEHLRLLFDGFPSSVEFEAQTETIELLVHRLFSGGRVICFHRSLHKPTIFKTTVSLLWAHLSSSSEPPVSQPPANPLYSRTRFPHRGLWSAAALSTVQRGQATEQG